jgi:hypothetical protein
MRGSGFGLDAFVRWMKMRAARRRIKRADGLALPLRMRGSNGGRQER